jgi:hypothetical protein
MMKKKSADISISSTSNTVKKIKAQIESVSKVIKNIEKKKKFIGTELPSQGMGIAEFVAEKRSDINISDINDVIGEDGDDNDEDSNIAKDSPWTPLPGLDCIIIYKFIIVCRLSLPFLLL